MKISIPDITKRIVKLSGLAPLMFDRYAGDNKTQLPVEAKMYFLEDGKSLCIPAVNLMSFLSAKNTTSVAKIIGGKSYSAVCDAMLSYVTVQPNLIPITRNGAPIMYYGFVNGRDDKGGIFVHNSVARLAKGIPNPKERPTIELPWEIVFTVTLFKNPVVDETFLQTAFVRGGIAMGIGTYRGVFGKFEVIGWD